MGCEYVGIPMDQARNNMPKTHPVSDRYKPRLSSGASHRVLGLIPLFRSRSYRIPFHILRIVHYALHVL